MKKKTYGLRERQARKRHRRGGYWCSALEAAAVAVPLKAGRKHIGRLMRLSIRLAVAKSEKRANGAPENC